MTVIISYLTVERGVCRWGCVTRLMQPDVETLHYCASELHEKKIISGKTLTQPKPSQLKKNFF